MILFKCINIYHNAFLLPQADLKLPSYRNKISYPITEKISVHITTNWQCFYRHTKILGFPIQNSSCYITFLPASDKWFILIFYTFPHITVSIPSTLAWLFIYHVLFLFFHSPDNAVNTKLLPVYHVGLKFTYGKDGTLLSLLHYS